MSTQSHFARLSSFLVLLFITHGFGPPAVRAADESWELIWQDEFEGPTLDYSKWGVEVNAFGGGNHEAQMYTDRKENVRVEDGHLVIELKRDNPNIQGTQREFSSGRVRTKHRGDWKYGRFEIRAQLPAGQAVWPAIWMLPTDETYGGWARSGEIDIMEAKGHIRDVVSGTLHYGDNWPNNRYSGKEFKLDSGTFTDSFHTFACEWEEGVIRWYVDDTLYQTQTKWDSVGHEFPAPFDQRFHLLLNIAVGGNFGGGITGETPDSAKMLVDFVRVYKRK